MSASNPAESSTGASATPGAETPVRHALRRLSVYVRRNWPYYLKWFFVVLLYVAAFNALPLAVGWAINGLVDPNVGREAVIERCWILFGLAVVGGGLRFLSRQLVFNAAREIEYEIRNDLFEHLQKLPQSFYFEWRTGDLMSRCVNDLNSVRMLLGPGLLSVAQSPILFLGAFIAMSSMSLKLAILMMLPYPLFIVISRVLGAALYRRSLASQQSLAAMSNRVQESIAGIAVVKAYAMEDDQASRFAEANEHLRERQLGLVRTSAAMPAITGLLPALGLAMVVGIGIGEIQAGNMETGDLVSFTIFARVLTFPTFIMGYSISLVQRGASAMQRIDEVLSVEPSIADQPDSVVLPEVAGRVEFRGLSFAYPADEPADEPAGEAAASPTESGDAASADAANGALAPEAPGAREAALLDIDLEIPAGSSIGIVGPVGSGKSTLASIIPRLYEVEDGVVFIDGVDVNRVALKSLRESIAMVPQDSFLFSMSLADNVAYGLAPDASLDEVRSAAERAQLSRDVEDLPRGYETLVGERGVMLSGGQRQRTALARALALDPKILILDDTLSAVDAETERRIQAGLDKVFSGRTVVVVASRVNSVQNLDQIVVLDGGRIVERGTHAELIAEGGLYWRLAQEQEEEQEHGQGPSEAESARAAGEGA
ncbi:MAG: ABC transporter ATP-binding protein [Myxococcota bacterium]